MEDKNWIRQTNIYEVNLRQYTREGTIRAFMEHLPRLRDMGVETLWFMPLTPISRKEMKGSLGSYYACSDYEAMNPEFGTMSDFAHLVALAHDYGFRVILDWVANHTGWDHVWTVDHPEWYKKDPNGNFKKASGMDDIIELDFNQPQMRKAMIESMRFWLRETSIDGFRCDLAFWVELSFWQEAIPELNRLKPLFWLAELDPLDHPGYMQVFDSAYTWTWMHKTVAWFRKETEFDELFTILGRYLHAPGLPAWFTSNHDENSWNGSEYEKYGHLALPLAVHSCTWAGIPLIYSGQEIPNHRRLRFFEKDPLDWPGSCELHEFYKMLLKLRKENPALHADGETFLLHPAPHCRAISYLRKSGTIEVLVVLNLDFHPISFHLADDWLEGSFREIFTGGEMKVNQSTVFQLKEGGFQVFVRI
jgi:glycosidase